MNAEIQFGSFFREVRKGLGVNLREFCRRNSFDPGNISRLERGLSRPSPELLGEYANALRLKEGSVERERFMRLADEATRKIRLPRQQGHRNWVTARRLEEWAGTEVFRSLLPQ